jgi:Fe-S-cluster containining protein
MVLETNINRIEELTRQKEDDDRQYRRLLQECDLTIEEIDAIVHRQYKEVSEQIECRECANCCKVFHPLLKVEDIDRLARRLRIPKRDFITQYLVEYENGKGCFFKLTPCPFLVDNACTVYPDRPDVCRSYPNLYRERFVFRLNDAFSNCSVCPIVYNVYERVKREIRARQVTTVSSEDE